MSKNPRGVTLLSDHPSELFSYFLTQNEIAKSRFWIRYGEQICEFAAWPADWNRLALCAINEGSQLFSELPVTQLCLVSSNLHGDRTEPRLVTVHVSFQQSLELFSTRHLRSLRYSPATFIAPLTSLMDSESA
jgi:hypothetical protein